MKAKKSIALFLVFSLCLALALCLGVSAEDAAADNSGKIFGMETFNFVSLIVLAVVLVIVVVVCIVKRAKVAESARAYKSEMKKITWFPWKSVWRCTVFVLICMVAIAVVVGFLDIAIFKVQDLMAGR
jgi:preprotein translocase subunit SecE